MNALKFQIVQPEDRIAFQTIAAWYLDEWGIPIDKTIQKLKTVTEDKYQFQVLMTMDDVPVSTGGLYNHVGLHDKEPRFKIHKHWLALVYTKPDHRHKGYGALICDFIQDHTKELGIDNMYLFTDTAEQLYKRLGWIELERIALGNRTVVVMKKDLLHDNGH